MKRQTASWLPSMLLALVITSATSAEEGKQDVLGLTTGMTFADANKFIMSKQWRCMKDISPMAGPMPYTCETNVGQMNLNFAPNLEGNPLVKVRLFFESADTYQNVVKSISAQYGKTPSEVKDMLQWDLGSQLLRLRRGSKYMLDLLSPLVAEANDRRTREIELQRNPTPKF